MEDDTTKSFIDFIIEIDDINQSIPTIIDFLFENQKLKIEYSKDELSKLVLIDKAMKHNLETIGVKNSDFKSNKDNKIIKDFYMIVGSEFEKLLKEICDFSIIFYTITVDILLCEVGMKKEQLEEDLNILMKKYLVYIEKLKDYTNKLNIYKNYID